MSVLITLTDVEPAVRLGKLLEEEQLETEMVSPLDDFRSALRRAKPSVVVMTGGLLDPHNMQRVRELLWDEVAVIGFADVRDPSTDEKLKSAGYVEIFSKPVVLDEVVETIKQLLHRQEMSKVTGLIGESEAIREVVVQVEQIAPVSSTVLIEGESGTGKELVARAIHAASTRRFHPLVVIHCGALTETLLESELFGYEKGAFTGAQYRKKGKFEIAEGGTVFLDEIGDITLKTQTDLLRVLQEREINRVGGNQILKVDFRCVAATNKNLEQLIGEGKFRSDLFYRLNVFHMELPSLRERREDIPLLVNHFVQKFSSSMNKRITHVSPSAMNQLQQQPWPGNVRELENAVERAMVVAQEPMLRDQDFVFRQTIVNGSNGGKTLEEVERAYILRVLDECGQNQSRAAEKLGIDRVTLHHKLKRYGWTRSQVETR